MQNIIVAGLVALTIVSQSSADAAPQEKAAIRGLMQQWLTAYNNKDLDALLSLYSDKIYFANNESSLKQGTNAIRRNFAPQFTGAANVTIDFLEETITVGKTLAHIGGKYRVNLPQAGGSVSHAYGRVLLIFEKENDQWKLIVDIDNKGNDISANDFKGD